MLAQRTLLAARSLAVPFRRYHASPLTAALQYTFPGVKQAYVDDVRVNVTFVNHLGQKVTLPGRAGQTLLDVAQEHDYNWLEAQCAGGGYPEEVSHGDWNEPKYGEGTACTSCHVILAKSVYEQLEPPMDNERQTLESHPLPEQITSTSRLGCQIVLDKSMDGIIVHIPDGPPTDIP